jgi:hypothetical protein
MVIDSKRGAIQNHNNRLRNVYFHTGSEVLRAYVKDLSRDLDINVLTIGRMIGYANPYHFKKFVDGLTNGYGDNSKVWALLIKISVKFQYPLNMSNYMHLIETKFILDEADFLSDSEELIQYNSKNLKENKK